MKKEKFCIPFRLLFPCLVLVAVLTIDPGLSGSKYVWREDIIITLKVNYSDGGISPLPETLWKLEITGIGIETTQVPGQWILYAEEGYALPESLLIKIGEMEYRVYTDGQNNPEEISFEPGTGMLILAESLLLDSSLELRIIADRVPESNQRPPSEEGNTILNDVPIQEGEPTQEGESTTENESTPEAGPTQEHESTQEAESAMEGGPTP